MKAKIVVPLTIEEVGAIMEACAFTPWSVEMSGMFVFIRRWIGFQISPKGEREDFWYGLILFNNDLPSWQPHGMLKGHTLRYNSEGRGPKEAIKGTKGRLKYIKFVPTWRYQKGLLTFEEAVAHLKASPWRFPTVRGVRS